MAKFFTLIFPRNFFPGNNNATTLLRLDSNTALEFSTKVLFFFSPCTHYCDRQSDEITDFFLDYVGRLILQFSKNWASIRCQWTCTRTRTWPLKFVFSISDQFFLLVLNYCGPNESTWSL